MVTDPTRMCELLVGLPEVTVLGLEDEVGAPLSIHVETRARRPGCSECGVLARVKDRPVVTLVDLAAFGRPTRLVWHKFRWHGAEPTDNPIEVRSLGRTLKRWKHQIVAWHTAHVTNGPTEAVNNLIKGVKRAAFGFTSFRNYRIRSLLYAGKPDWALLATIKPR